VNFLFWNVNRRGQSETIAALAHSLKADVIVLAEGDESAGTILRSLNPPGTAAYLYVAAPVQSSAVQLYTKFPTDFITAVGEQGRTSLWHVSLPGQVSFILAALHLPSKLWKDEHEQAEIASEISKFIRFHEIRLGHDRTVVVGDFNMNPFERGILTAYAFNAVMTRKDALKSSRRVNDSDRPFFFNPMWSLFHDGDMGPPGTFHHSSPSHLSVYWNMFDQVLLRPSLLRHFNKSSLRIVTTCENESLLDELGKPLASDHLPITFTLEL
jgi:endonuclease/exonuclease/phosphatase family metal-dependent hydrolase